LQAVSRKISVASSIDWEAIAGATEGFSGADLQALVYNAHLEVVHVSIAANPELTRTAYVEVPPVKYTMLGGPEGESVVSRAEESAIQRRVNCSICISGDIWINILRSCTKFIRSPA
jgi:peroxin-1